jgi:hypothetical protein
MLQCNAVAAAAPTHANKISNLSYINLAETSQAGCSQADASTHARTRRAEGFQADTLQAGKSST